MNFVLQNVLMLTAELEKYTNKGAPLQSSAANGSDPPSKSTPGEASQDSSQSSTEITRQSHD